MPPHLRALPARSPRPKRILGKAHNHRVPKGSARARMREMFPLAYCFLYGDDLLRRRYEVHQEELSAMRAEAIVICIYCRALMIHAAAGIFFCPYQRARVHERARQVFANSSSSGEEAGGAMTRTPLPVARAGHTTNFASG